MFRYGLIGLLVGASVAIADEQALKERLDALKARGEPVEVMDLKPADPGPEKNAGAEIEAAIKAVRDDTPEYRELDNQPGPLVWPVDEHQEELLAMIGKQNEPAIALLIQAASKPSAVANVDWKSPAIQVLLPTLNGVRQCANVTKYDTYNQLALGQSDLAFGRFEIFERLAEFSESQRALVAILVGTGIRRMGADTLANLAPAIQIGNAEHAVKRADVEERIQRLMDGEAIRRGYAMSIATERVSIVDFLDCLQAGTVKIADIAPASQPAAETRLPSAEVMTECKIFLIDYLNSMQTHVNDEDFPSQDRAMKDAYAAREKFIKDERNSVLAMVLPSLNRGLMQQYRILTAREAAATALAMRLFATDHQGKLPDKLDELVPKYLPRVPRDYLASNQPLKYRAGDKPILWSVGQDGIDHGGKISTRSAPGDDVFALSVAAKPTP